jgi:putative MFS transporter
MTAHQNSASAEYRDDAKYRRLLLILLSTATFFEGYDFLLINLVLPLIQKDFNVSISTLGVSVSIIAVGTIVAFLVVRMGDRFGRRPVLQLTIFAYTLFTACTAFSQGLVSFVVFQFLARVFLVGEWGLATVMIAEEFPEKSRGMGIAIVQSMAGLGAVMAGALYPLVAHESFGWRGMYLIGLAPLVLVGIMRSRLRETVRYVRMKSVRTGDAPSFFLPWKKPYGYYLFWVSMMWILVYVCYTANQVFWVHHVVNGRGWNEQMVSRALIIAYLLGISGFYFAGRSLDWLGRKKTAALFFGCGTIATFCAFQTTSVIAITVSLFFMTFFTGAFLPVSSSFTTEIFPTEIRANSVAWANNLLGRIGMVGAPAIVGFLASPLGGVGNAVTMLGLAPILAACIVLIGLPETRWREITDFMSDGFNKKEENRSQ